MIRTAITAVVCAVVGFCVPEISKRVCRYKYAQRDRIFTPEGLWLSVSLKLLCALLCAAGGVALSKCAAENPAFIAAAFVLVLCVVLSLTDLQIHIIPNEAILLLLAAGILLQLLTGGWDALLGGVAAMVILVAVFSVVAKCVGFWKVGAGDVKLAGAMGLVLGYPSVLTGVITMAVVMMLFCAVGLITKRLRKTTMLPLAPFLSAGFITGLIRLLG